MDSEKEFQEKMRRLGALVGELDRGRAAVPRLRPGSWFSF